ncbi:MAG: hypothetical protein A3C35_07310 [Omnitrophica bacterium RIFCSPHIGHO2_02_FULL_46_11]|nr:MAG: hypothetical protein A3C35_07310 [Omnitrophica bacterium RIFCSPHIGHO2_02_FULL_46_11]OGW87368.1 MAG: hypothetical protein A3A81_04580 [Omnitrophica bacterium RIFCSPLOWO2_01_FULL_45_10b]
MPSLRGSALNEAEAIPDLSFPRKRESIDPRFKHTARFCASTLRAELDVLLRKCAGMTTFYLAMTDALHP